jgi:hypothetical protein
MLYFQIISAVKTCLFVVVDSEEEEKFQIGGQGNCI